MIDKYNFWMDIDNNRMRMLNDRDMEQENNNGAHFACRSEVCK